METHATGKVPGARRFLRSVRYISAALLLAASTAFANEEGDLDLFEDQFGHFNFGFVVFAASGGASGDELWRTNGTTRDTRMVKDIFPGSNGSGPQFFTRFRGAYAFRAYDGVTFNGLWRTDGTDAGTMKITARVTAGAGNIIPPSFKVFNGELYFTTVDSHPDSVQGLAIWKTDGTDAGTVRVKGLDPANRNTNPTSRYNPYFTFGTTLYISARDKTNGWELWKTDGTEAGTVLVKDIFPGTTINGDPNSSFPDDFAVLNGELYFTATDSEGRQLWKTDGTEAGTVRITDRGTNGLLRAVRLKSFRGTLYFAGEDSAHGVELWRSDGTAAGTTMVEDINPGANGSGPASFTVFWGRLYFSAAVNDGGFITPRFIWTTDGTEPGTRQVAQARVGGNRFTIGQDFTAGIRAFYFVGENGMELWRSNGTEAGTFRVKLISPPPPCTPSDCNGVLMHDFQIINGVLLFKAGDAVNGREQWKSNGTEPGTMLLKDICPGPCSSHFIPRN